MVPQVDIVPREERCDEGPRPQPMPSMPVSGMGYWQQGQPQQQQQQQQQPMQSGPGDQHMGLPQRPPGMQMDPAMMQAYYMVSSPKYFARILLIDSHGSKLDVTGDQACNRL